MQPKLRALELYRKFSPKSHQFSHLLPKQLCTMTDSPRPSIPSTGLPCNQNPKATNPPGNGDFAIISYAKGNVGENSNIETLKSVATRWLFQAYNTDVNRVSEILKKHYPSEDAVVKTLHESGIKATHDLISLILKRFCNQWLQALGVFTWAKQQTGYVHTPKLYDFMVDILGKCTKFSLMWNLVEEMKGLNGYVSRVTMSTVMRRLARNGKYEDAIDAFRGMEKYGVKKDTEALNVLIDILTRYGRVKDAHAMALEFRDCIAWGHLSFNNLIHGYCKARLFDDARKIMEEMEKHGFHPNVVSYTFFIEAYCELKDFRNVEIILNEMQENGCKPDVIFYTTYMHTLGKARRTKEALEVYENMKRNGFTLDTNVNSVLIYVLCKSGKLKDAWDVFEGMEKQGVGRDARMYTIMISSACEHLQDERALKLLQRMEEDLCKPDLLTYVPLLKMCCRKKRMKMLKFLLNHMFENNVSMDNSTYCLLVHGLCKVGELKYACYFFQEWVLKGMLPWDVTYEMLLKALERKNMVEMKGKIEKLMLRAQQININ